jgi:hypothetical protein
VAGFCVHGIETLVSINAGNFMSDRATVGFSGRTQFHEDSYSEGSRSKARKIIKGNEKWITGLSEK